MTTKDRGLKYDAGKTRMDLVMHGLPNALKGVGDILTFGAKKYRAHSWRHVPNGVARYEAAAMRHLLAHSAGEFQDPESGFPHISHAICNLMFVQELLLQGDKYDPESPEVS